MKFWRSATGREPVREWLKELPRADRHRIGDDLREIQWTWPLGMPLVRGMGQGLWEARSTLPSSRIARVLFGFHDSTAVILHGFIKKSQKTPDGDLELARQRLKEMTR